MPESKVKPKGHHQSNKLSARAVATATKSVCDGRGLWLQVSAYGTKAWLLRYMVDGKAHKRGLGALHTVSLAEARRRAAEARLKILDGIDPIEERKARRASARIEAAKAMNFRQCAEAYIDWHKDKWKNAKHGAQWRSTLATYVFPIFGDLPVASIDTGLVTKALEPIWKTKTETASRLRGRIESILGWAATKGYRAVENPARWQDHLENLLPAKSKIAPVKHHAAVSYAEMPSFMAALRAKKKTSARALEFAILTAARSGEVIGARVAEIDLAKKVWTVPAERMKSRREHTVPLCGLAVEIAQEAISAARGPYLFAGRRHTSSLSESALLELLRGLRGHGATVHGFRSAFRDWAGNETNFARELAEAALAHVVGDKAEQAYRRSDALEKRRKLMDYWADHCEQPPAVRASTVTPIREAVR